MTVQEELDINLRLRYVKEQRNEQATLAFNYEKQGNQIAQNTREVAVSYLNDEIKFLEKLLKPA